MPHPPKSLPPSWGEGVAAYAATDEGASLPRPVSMGRAGLGPVPAQRRGPLMGTAGAQRPKGTRRGGFQPSEKPSPSWGEGVAAYAATDEGSSIHRPASIGRAGLGPVPAQRRGPLMGTAGAPTQRPKGTRRGGFQPPEKPSPSWGEGVTAYAATDEGASLPRPVSMGRAGLGPVPAQRRGPLMGTAGAQSAPLRKGRREPAGAASSRPKSLPPPGGKVSRRMPRRMRGRSSARLWPQGGTPKNTSSPPSGRAGGSRGGELWNQ